MSSLRFQPVKILAALLVSIPLYTIAQASDGTPQVGEEARKALAVTTGELQVQGLQEPVRVLRDRWGVAHIYARKSA